MFSQITERFNMELEYRIPRSITYLASSWKFPEIFGDSCKNTTSFLWVFVENRFLPFAPVDFRRKPKPVPRTQVLPYSFPGNLGVVPSTSAFCRGEAFPFLVISCCVVCCMFPV